jgi:hypothetical protein
VDLTSDADVTAATERGVRSLMVRGLVEISSTGEFKALDEELSLLITPLLAGKVVLSSFMTVDALSVIAKGATLFHYDAGDESWRTEVISGAGVHYISVSDPADSRGITRTLVEQSFENGIEPPDGQSYDGPPMYLCVAGPAAAEVGLLLVRRAELRSKRLDRESGQLTEVEPPASLDVAFALLNL